MLASALLQCLLVQWIAIITIVHSKKTAQDEKIRQESLCRADKKEPWTYRGRNGPKYWGETYPQCYGDAQSPIDIDTKLVTRDESLQPLLLSNYDVPMSSATVENNGHTIQVTPTDGTERFITIDGSKYTLRQFHFHWGYTYNRGSEHLLNGEQYAMELHFVHMNEDNEIAVVGVIFKEGREANAALQKIVEVLPQVKYKGTNTTLESGVDLNKLLPENPASYYRYQGSLTTPECSEGVSWSVLTDLLTVGKKQIDQFRRLYSVEKEDASIFCGLAGNYRPVQPLNGRKVTASG